MSTNTIGTVKSVAKVIVAALGLVLAAVNDHIDLVPVQYRGYVTALIGLLTLLGIYHAPYGPLGANRASTAKLEGSTGVPAKAPVQHKPVHKPRADD